MSLTAREEILLELYRALDPEQRAEVIKSMRALVDANRITQDKMKSPIRVVGNTRIEAKYGRPRAPTRKRGKPRLDTKPKPRRPDRNQDDNR